MTQVFQPKLDVLFEPDAQLDHNIIVIGNPETETNLNLLPEFLKEFEACKLFAFDIETFASSKESWQALWWYKNHIRLMQIGVESGLVLIIDLGGWKEYPLRDSILENQTIKDILDMLGDKLFDNSVAVLGAGLKFDLTTVREKFGFIGRQCRDVLLLSRVIWAGVGVLKAGKGEKRSERCTLPHSLKGVAERFGFEVDKTQQVSAWGWQMSNAQLNYAASDVRILFPIFLKMRALILEQGLVKTAFIECNALSVFVNMEYFGMPVDLNKANETLTQYKARQKELEAIIEAEFPGVSYTSNPQMLAAFQARWPEANLESISKDAIGGIDHPVIKAFLEVKPLNTDIAYIEGVIKNSFRGSIRCNFNQLAGSGSGRSSCTQNISVKRKQHVIGSQLQNPSKNFRHIFTSEDPEMGLGIYDSSGSHMRIATQYCKDPLLVKIFTDDFDGHSILASDIAKMCGDDFSPEYIMGLKAKKDLQDEGKYELTEQEQKDVKKALKTYRNLAKTLLYSSLNGSGVATMLTAIHKVGMSWADEEDAKKIRDLFYSRYPELIKLIKSTPKKATKYSFDFSRFKDVNGHNSIGSDWGLVKALGGRHVYMKKMEGTYGKQVPFNDAVSALWLATEADGMKKLMYEVQNKFWETPEWRSNIVHMAHDEILFTYYKKYTKEIAEFVVGKMNEVFSEYVDVIPALDGATLNNPTIGMKTSWDEK